MTSLVLFVLAQTVTPVRIVQPIDGGAPVSVQVWGTVATTGGAGSGSTTIDGGFVYVDQRSTSNPWVSRISDGTDNALVSGSGSLQVTCDNCGGSTFEDNDAFTPGTSSVSNIGFEVDDTATTAITENSAGAGRMTTFRAQHHVLRDGAGNERSANVTASNALVVDNSGVTQPVSGTFWQATQPVSAAALPLPSGAATAAAQTDKSQYTRLTDGTDDALVSAAGALIVDGSATTQPVSGTVTANLAAGTNNIGDVDVLSIAAGNNNIGDVDVASLPSVTIGTFPDNEPFSLAQLAGNAVSTGVGASGTGTLRTATLIHDGTDTALVSAAGALVVDGSAVTQPVSVAGTVTVDLGANNDVIQGTASNFNAEVQGDAAHAATVSGNPIQLGAYAESDAAALDATGVAEGEITRLKADLNGRLFVDTSHPNRIRCQVNSTATTLTALGGSCAAPGASVSIYVTDVIMSSSAASTTTADQLLQLKFGTGGSCGTGTTVLHQCFNQANGGCAAQFATPLKVTANNELCWMDAVAGTKSITVSGFLAP